MINLMLSFPIFLTVSMFYSRSILFPVLQPRQKPGLYADKFYNKLRNNQFPLLTLLLLITFVTFLSHVERPFRLTVSPFH